MSEEEKKDLHQELSALASDGLREAFLVSKGLVGTPIKRILAEVNRDLDDNRPSPLKTVDDLDMFESGVTWPGGTKVEDGHDDEYTPT